MLEVERRDANDFDRVKVCNAGDHDFTVLLVGDRYIKLSPGASAWVRCVVLDGRNLFCDCEAGCAHCATENRSSTT